MLSTATETIISHVASRPLWAVAVMVATPKPVAVTRPLLSTVATPSSLDSQTKSPGEVSVASSGRLLTRRSSVSPVNRPALVSGSPSGPIIQHSSMGTMTRTSISARTSLSSVAAARTFAVPALRR